ncbi:putative protein OS=Eoetvoesiella caeni OX=645616 GN=DFR37_103448 PE=4 SV=1 [Eoetvoesiella caeni]
MGVTPMIVCERLAGLLVHACFVLQPSGIMRRLLFALFSLLSMVMGSGSSVMAQSQTWPPLPSRLDFATPYGKLGIKSYEYVYESRLQIDDVEIRPPIEGLLNITYAFDLPDAEAALVSVSDGDLQCPFKYRWVVLHRKGYSVSPPIGACSEKIKVSVKGRRFFLETPNNQKADKIDTYIYDGKALTRRSRKFVQAPQP